MQFIKRLMRRLMYAFYQPANTPPDPGARTKRLVTLIMLITLGIALYYCFDYPKSLVRKSFTEVKQGILTRDFERAKIHMTRNAARAWWLDGMNDTLRRLPNTAPEKAELINKMIATYDEMLASAETGSIQIVNKRAFVEIKMLVVAGNFQAVASFPTLWQRDGKKKWQLVGPKVDFEELPLKREPVTDWSGDLKSHQGYPPFCFENKGLPIKGDFEQKSSEGNCPDGMVQIPEGPFVYRISGQRSIFSDQEDRIENTKSFCIDQYEVSRLDGNKPGVKPIPVSRPNVLPWVSLSWEQARDACEHVGKRLCTNLEWEKAAGGPQGFLYPWGNEPDFDKCNTYDPKTGPREIAPTGSFPQCKSVYNVYDTCGNVSEWVSDPWQPGKPDRVIRGGSFNYNHHNDQGLYPFFGWQFIGYGETLDALHHHPPNVSYPDDGFRCCSDVI